jgi:hypothetical protein
MFPLQKAFIWQSYLYQIPPDWFTDDDSLEITVHFIDNAGIWLRFFNGASKTFIGEPILDDVTYSVIVTATDEFGLSDFSLLSINVDRNYSPMLVNPKLLLNYTYRAG